MKVLYSLKLKLAVFLSLLTLLPTLLVGLFAYGVLRDSLMEFAKRTSQDMLLTQMGNFDLTAASIQTALNDFATAEVAQAYIQLRHDKQNNAYYSNLLLMASKMDTLMSQRGDAIRAAAILWNDGDTPLVRGDSSAFNLYGGYRDKFPYRELIKAGAGIHWQPLTDGNGNTYIYVYRPLYSLSAGETVGVVVFVFYKDYIGGLFNMQTEPGSFGVLFDSGGAILIKPSGLNDSQNRFLQTFQFSDETGPHVFLLDSDEGSYLTTYTVSSVNGWKYVFFNPLQNVKKSTNAITFMVVAVMLIASAAAIIAGLFLYRYINDPIQQLALTMGKFRAGMLDARVGSARKDELGLLGSGFDQMAEQTLLLIENIKTEQEEKREAELRFLQAQISPHFLYNTLNTVKVLARSGRDGDISSMVTSLISLLRLTSNGNEHITLEQELAYVKNYITIMEFRKDQRFSLVLNVTEAAAQCVVPKFTLQPIVENSLIHGFGRQAGRDCKLMIEASVESGLLRMIITDNGVGFSPEFAQAKQADSDSRFSKVGTKNVDERIKLYYGAQYGLHVESEIGKGTKTMLILPAESITDSDLPMA